MIAQTITKDIDADLIQWGFLAPLPETDPNPRAIAPLGHSDREYILDCRSLSPSQQSDMSFHGEEEEVLDYNFLRMKKPPVTGLFCHDLFKMLLYKAKTTAYMGRTYWATCGILRPSRFHGSSFY